MKKIMNTETNVWKKHGKIRIYFKGTTKKNGFYYDINSGWSFKPQSHEMIDWCRKAEIELKKVYPEIF
jgi:hypothetical protein